MKVISKKAAYFEEEAPSMMAGVVSEMKIEDSMNRIFITWVYLNEGEGLMLFYTHDSIARYITSDSLDPELKNIRKCCEDTDDIVREDFLEYEAECKEMLKSKMIEEGCISQNQSEWEEISSNYCIGLECLL